MPHIRAAALMISAPVLTPHRSLTLSDASEELEVPAEQGARLEQAFARGSGHGLLNLGIDELGTALPSVLSYWRGLGTRYLTPPCALPRLCESSTKPPLPPPRGRPLWPA